MRDEGDDEIEEGKEEEIQAGPSRRENLDREERDQV